MNWLQVIISLIGVIGLIFLLFYLLRKINKQVATTSGSKLKIIDRAATGRDSSLLVVSVGGKLMLLGVSSGKMTGNIEKICDLDLSEEEYFGPEDQTDKPGLNFSDVLSNIMVFGAKKRELTEKKTKGESRSQGEGEEDTVESDNQKSNEGERL
ncbi:MAG: flagellar biosynthetic protein FliO [Oscillospiraceae bacterium]|nr:flagellar biosynthetic protein FliO [Oscillospiraceae bacterium]